MAEEVKADTPEKAKVDELFRELGTAINKATHNYIFKEQEAHDILLKILECNDPKIDGQWVAFFSSIQSRGPQGDEIKGFLRAASEFDPNIQIHNGRKPKLCEEPLYAICGSGKDTWKTFNISTAASFIAASTGIKVLKPGSSSVSSVSGNLDVIKTLKMDSFSDPKVISESLEKTGIAVASFHNLVPKYAARYDGRFSSFHPLSYVLPVAAIPYHLDGISYGIADWRVMLGASVIKHTTGIKNVTVASSQNSRGQTTDEFCPYGTRKATIYMGERISHFEKLESGTEEQKQAISHGETHEENAQKIVKALTSKRDEPTTKAACYAAATIIHEATNEPIYKCYLKAVEAVESGKAYKKMMEYRDFCQEKRRESVGIKKSEPELAM